MTLSLALSSSNGTERAFERARELLRQEGLLTNAECDELDALFDEVNGSQFMALARDPKHHQALKQYDRYVHRHIRPIMTVMVIFFVVCVLVGVFLVS